VAYTLEWIAGRIGGRVRGNKDRVVRSICPPERPEKNSIVFIKNRKVYSGVDRTAGACFVFGFNAEDEPADDCILVDPKKSSTAFVELLSLFEEPDGTGPGVSGSASIAPGAEIGEGASVGPFAVVGQGAVVGASTRIGPQVLVGNNCRIGKGCILHHHVTLYPGCRVDDNVVIHAGAVIGSDGFGYVLEEGAHRKIPQIGSVIIGRNVEIGANTTIDRATLGNTLVGEGTKIDNLVQIGHNVEIGKNVIICALCGISGSVKIGNNVVIAGAVGLKDHIVIEDDVYIGAKSGVMERHVKRGKKLLGIPAADFKQEMEFYALKPKIKSMFSDIGKIKKKLGL